MENCKCSIGIRGLPKGAEVWTIYCETHADAPRLKELNAELLAVVNEQAEDDGLWFVAQYASEAYLQQELRRLHAIIEAKATGATA